MYLRDVQIYVKIAIEVYRGNVLLMPVGVLFSVFSAVVSWFQALDEDTDERWPSQLLANARAVVKAQRGMFFGGERVHSAVMNKVC